jgi:hypothetical protein
MLTYPVDIHELQSRYWISGAQSATIGVMAGWTAFARGLLTMVLLASWNVTTTHCALAAAITPASPPVKEDAADKCPMHASKKPAPEPRKKKGCADLPCCKTLPATPAAKLVAVARSAENVARVDYIHDGPDQLELQCLRKPLPALDTGPPRPNKFTEVIFQRSIPAHAPPGLS